MWLTSRLCESSFCLVALKTRKRTPPNVCPSFLAFFVSPSAARSPAPNLESETTHNQTTPKPINAMAESPGIPDPPLRFQDSDTHRLLDLFYESLPDLSGLTPGVACAVIVLHRLLATLNHRYRSALISDENLKKGHLLAVAVLLDKNQMWKHEQLAIQKSNSSSFSDLMESDEMMAALWTHKESSLFMPSSWKSTDRRPPHDADEWLSLARANCLICEDSPAAGMTMSIYVHATMTNQMREFGYSGKFFRPPAVIRIRYSPQDFPKLDRTWSPMHFAIRESPTGDGPESRGRQ